MIEKNTIWKASSLLLLAFFIFLEGTPQNLRPFVKINSPYNESHAVLSPFGSLFFSVGYHPENSGGQTDSGDIWLSEMTTADQWSKPQRVKELSTAGNDVVVGFPDPITIMVYHDGQEMSQGIHLYSKFGNSWNYLRPLQLENFKNQTGHFSGRLSADGKVIIMSMKSMDGFGNEDIYVSFRQNEFKWTSPLNLGPVINTYAQEQTPYLSEDTRTLYFSSNANAAGRGKNIFYSQRLDDSWEKWTHPMELGTANSIGSDSGYAKIFPQENLAIFSTTANSEGLGDFMLIGFENISWNEEKAIELVSEDVVDSLHQVAESLDNPVQIISKNTNEDTSKNDSVEMATLSFSKQAILDENAAQSNTIATQEQHVAASGLQTKARNQKPDSTALKMATAQNPILNKVQILDNQTGKPVVYKLTVSDNNSFMKELDNQEEMKKEFETWDWKHIMVLAKGYLPIGFNVEEWQKLEENELYLEPASTGASLVLKNIQFGRGTSEFADAKTLQELDRLVLFMNENEDIIIRLEGHTDNIGDPGLNKELSLSRASKIRTHLALKGIDYERIRTSGWGGTRPLADNNTEEGREMNRRVELYIER